MTVLWTYHGRRHEAKTDSQETAVLLAQALRDAGQDPEIWSGASVVWKDGVWEG